MNKIDYDALVLQIKGTEVERPNKASLGTLSGHAAGEPFEKSVYSRLKTLYGSKIYKQYEYLNDLYLRNPKVLTVEARNALFSSPTVLFLLSRGETATRRWNPSNVFEEKQNDTADIIYYDDGFYDLIDIKTRNIAKSAQAPNIISAYKVAQMCAFMIDNEDYDVFRIHYIEVDWEEERSKGLLVCRNAHYGALFKARTETLYINWAAAMQIQFHVSNLDQTWTGSMHDWAVEYLRCFVQSARERCAKMEEEYIRPFMKYIA